MNHHLLGLLTLVAGLSLANTSFAIQPEAGEIISATDASKPKEALPEPLEEQGILVFDYQKIPVRGDVPLDLFGIHALKKLNDWLYVGLGAHAPLFQGAYGGFMAGDVSLLAQKQLSGKFFASAGAAIGGGGGGRSVANTPFLSGGGGYVKNFIGLGYDFDTFSAGINYSRFQLTRSAIDHSQFDLFIQVPFTYTVGPYASSGRRYDTDSGITYANHKESILTASLDNFLQINPKGTHKQTINLIDLQYSYFLYENMYWFLEAGVGYRGLPLYNQLLGGVGYRTSITPRVNLYGQMAIGSGGFSPDRIDTGPGLLVYPKLSAEYLITDSLGLSLSGGYLTAPKGSSRNWTLGAQLNYHILPGNKFNQGDQLPAPVEFNGYRVHVYHQSERNVYEKLHGTQSMVNMLSVQFDKIIHKNFYIPTQVSIAHNTWFGSAGYGEVLMGIGTQGSYSSDEKFQPFAQLLVGTNHHGLLVKPEIGINYSLSDHLAVYGNIGKTSSIDGAGLYQKNNKLRADSFSLGVTYRFSIPSQ